MGRAQDSLDVREGRTCVSLAPFLKGKIGLIKAKTHTYKMQTDLDEATKYIFKGIRRMGMKIRNSEEEEIIIAPEDFKRFQKRVSEWTTPSPFSIHYYIITKHWFNMR